MSTLVRSPGFDTNENLFRIYDAAFKAKKSFSFSVNKWKNDRLEIPTPSRGTFCFVADNTISVIRRFYWRGRKLSTRTTTRTKTKIKEI